MPTTTPPALPAPPPPDPHAVVLRRWDLYFAVAFGLAVGFNLVTIWVTPWLPMGDYGGWLELIDVVARHDDPETLFSTYYALPQGFEPNSLVVHLGSWLAHLMPTQVVGKVMLSWYVVGLPLGALMLAQAFGRSRWLAFLALPLTFNALFNVGLLNFLVALPFLPMLLAIARNHATHRRTVDGVWLGVLLMLLFYAHVLAFLMAVGMIAPLLLVGLRRPRDIVHLGWVAPSLALLAIWVMRKYVQAEPTEAGLSLAGPEGLNVVFQSIDHRIEQFHAWGMRYFRDATDDVVFVVLALTWFGLMAASQTRPNSPPAERPRLLGALRDHALELVTLGCIGAYFALPSYMREIELIAERVVVPLLLLLAVWPRLRLERSRLHWLIVPAVIVSLVYPWLVHRKFQQFNRTSVAELPQLIADLPPRSRLAYVMLETEIPGFYMGPLWHIPKALMATVNGGVTDDSFAIRPHCPVQFQPGRSPKPLAPTFWRGGDLSAWDYVLVRGQALPFSPIQHPALEIVHLGENGWFLFKVRPPRPGVTVMAGSDGGDAVSHDCREGDVMRGFAVVTDAEGIESLQPQCSSMAWAGPWLGTGNARGNKRIGCETNERLIGIAGTIDGFVRSLAPVCAPLDTALDENRVERVAPSVGVQRGAPFRVTCPAGRMAAGFRGRAGARIDAMGLRCTDPAP